MSNLPEQTVFTVLGKEPRIAEMLKDCRAPQTGNRKQPFVIFLAKYKQDAMGNKPLREALLIYDLSKGDLSMIRRYVVEKKWSIVAYCLNQAFIPQGAENSWDNRPMLNHMRADIEALANGNSQIIEQRNEEISALKKRLEDYERESVETTRGRNRAKKSAIQETIATEDAI